jgi:endo-1,4-beta-xylanase
MKKRMAIKKSLLALACLVTFAGNSCRVSEPPPETLKDAYKDHFLIGVAIGRFQLSGRDSMGLMLLEKQFNSITADNMMKWERIHPNPGIYNFEPADQFVEFGEKHDMDMVGHCLVWHNQTPAWVFQDESGNPTVRDTLLQRMHDHIYTVVGRYRGKVHAWDVVNEAIGDDGQMRRTPWSEIIGDDYVQKAFEFAREADPGAILILNDYSLPNPEKRDGMVRLVKDLQSRGVKVDAVGMQGHYQLDYPSMDTLEAAIRAFAELDCRVVITELDINVLPNPTGRVDADVARQEEFQSRYNPYTAGLPDSVQLQLAEQYGRLFTVFVRNADKIDRVTFWGIHDGSSWKNNFPVRGRTNYPLLYDRQYQPKLAFDYVMKAAAGSD